RRAGLRGHQAGGARDRTGAWTAAPADGRAHGGHGSARAGRADGAYARYRSQTQHRSIVHRARHGRRVRACRPDHCPQSRPPDRGGPARGGARRQGRTGGLSRLGQHVRGARMSAAVLSVHGLHSYYGRAHILADVALEVARGEVVVLLGRNGAGKSTTMKTIMGLVRAAAGRIVFDGIDITARPPHDIARAGLGYVPEDRRIFTDLTVMENLEVGRQRPRENAPEWTPERLFAIFPNLAEMRNRPGGRMSGGEQ